MYIDLTYSYLTHHIIPGPQSFSYFIPLLLLPITLLIPRKTLSRWQSITVFIPIMLVATLHAWWKMKGVDVISVDVLLWALFLLVLKDPRNDFRFVKLGNGDEGGISTRNPVDKIKDGKDVGINDGSTGEHSIVSNNCENDSDSRVQGQSYPSGPSSFWKHLTWVCTLLVSIRLDNWKIGLSAHDQRQPPPPAFANRMAFVAQTLISFIRGYMILDLTTAYISYDPYFTDLSLSIFSPLPFRLLSFLPPQLLRSMIIGVQAWALISQMFYLPCLLPVSLHALGLLADEWSPHNWATYFGSPDAIFLHGIRGFWGEYSHQTMRHSSSGPGYAIADAFSLRGGSLLRYAVITTVAFGLNGVVHMGLVPPEPLHATVDANTIRLYVAAFFWVQPVAMLTEVVVIRLLKRLNSMGSRQRCTIRQLIMLANAIWVISWFSLCLPLLGEAGRQLGYWRVWPVPVSIWRALKGEEWIAWPSRYSVVAA